MTSYQWIASALLIVSVAMVLHACYVANGKWLGGAMLFLAGNALLVAPGCSSIDMHTAPPFDWPALRVIVHKSGFMARRECDGAIGGCAVPDFCYKVCDVYLQVDSPAVEAHERAHCAGYDHPGDDTMKALWANYRRMDGPRLCSIWMGVANYCALWPEDMEQCSARLSAR